MASSLQSLIALVEAPSGGTPRHPRGPALNPQIAARYSLSPVAALAVAFGLMGGCSNGITPLTDAGDSGWVDAGDAGDSGVDAGDAGDSGIDAGPLPECCAPAGSSCAMVACCGNLTCISGTCAQPLPACAGYAQACTSTSDCCSAGSADAGLPQMTCSPLDNAGNTACLYAQGGQACGGSVACAPPYVCLGDAGCQVPLNTTQCRTSSTSCQIGDDCSSAFTGGGVDPCNRDGLWCAFLGRNSVGRPIGACLQPFVILPDPQISAGFPSNYATCNPTKNRCQPANGTSQQTAPVCATYWNAANGNPVCLESCQTSNDCSSLAEHCVGGACVPVYCYYQDPTTAAQYTASQGSPTVSSDALVLFQPCQITGDSPSYCLPQFDNFLTSGLCFRVGVAGAGGLGAACNPRMYGNDPSSLCAAGFLCEHGTCVPWCDLDDKYVAPCKQNTQGNIGCATNPNLPLPQSGSVTRATGVCIEECSPYQPDSDAGSGCQPLTEDLTCTAQIPLCKLTGNDGDLIPAPGVCVNGIGNPLPVGALCNPVSGWADPCVTGALCQSQLDGGSFACFQICDPKPATTPPPPSCPAPTHCQAFGCATDTGFCKHQGICQ
jgi:hypothetical protein